VIPFLAPTRRLSRIPVGSSKATCNPQRADAADADGFASDMRATIEEVEASNLPDWAKNFAIWALLEQTKKPRGKGRPTRRTRDNAIRSAARRLVVRGYGPTRNEATYDRASASSIIHQALQRLGERRLEEKSINAIVMKFGSDHFIRRKVGPVFFEWLREQTTPEIADQFECDPNAPDIDPSVLK
jgi:hypothetical protein